MSQSSGVTFILGGGPRIGHAVAKAFSETGMKIALGSRDPHKSEAHNSGWQLVKVDVSDGESVRKAFESVRAKLGIPNLVVYNAAALTFASDDDPFNSVSLESFENDLKVNLTGAYTTLQETVARFNKLGNEQHNLPKVFIATGNVTPFQPVVPALTLGAGKAALVHLIQIANMAYGKHRQRFYFASQVTEDGGPVPYPDVDAEAHGRVYVELLKQKEMGKWDVWFVS